LGISALEGGAKASIGVFASAAAIPAAAAVARKLRRFIARRPVPAAQSSQPAVAGFAHAAGPMSWRLRFVFMIVSFSGWLCFIYGTLESAMREYSRKEPGLSFRILLCEILDNSASRNRLVSGDCVHFTR
jgi:hypothetical protein